MRSPAALGLLLLPMVCCAAPSVFSSSSSSSRAQASCGELRDGYDMAGHDIGFVTGSFSAEQCCEMCSQVNGCEAAVLGNTAANMGCYYKDSAVAGLTPKPGMVFLVPRVAIPEPPPTATCVEWRECFGGTKDDRGNCPGDPRYAAPGEYVHAGHQCESYPATGPQNCYRGGPDENATQEALCVPILSNGSTDVRVGHDNIIAQRDYPGYEGGCIYNDQSDQRRRVFREWRAVPKGASELQWVLTRAGYRVPPGALHTGGNIIAGRTLTSSTNKGSILPGWIPIEGGIMGKLQYDDNDAPGHPSVDYQATDYEIACCGSVADCTPVPPKPNQLTTPWVRFANTVPSEDHKVDCEVTLQGEKHVWQSYAYGVFSGWEGKFNNSCAIGNHSCGDIKIFESLGGGKRGPLLAHSKAYLPPGPVLIAFRGTWPVADNSSIEVIANSYVPPADGTATVRLFNLNIGTTPADGVALPASAQPASPASLKYVNTEVATAVNFGIGSLWDTVPSAPAKFVITDTASGAQLVDFTATPPLGASSVFLIGYRNASASAALRSQHVWLVDSPS